MYLGPPERPSPRANASNHDAAGDVDYGSTSRAAVLADAEALLSCYGTGEKLLPDMLHAVVELGFTSSVRFLQPGLLLQVCVTMLGVQLNAIWGRGPATRTLSSTTTPAWHIVMQCDMQGLRRFPIASTKQQYQQKSLRIIVGYPVRGPAFIV